MLKGKKIILESRIPPASAKAFEVRKGQYLRVLEIAGEQIADLVAFNLDDLREKFSAGRTRSENSYKLRISKGDNLYSNFINVMFTIVDDTCGVHDLLFPQCSRWVFKNRYKTSSRDGCLENMEKALSPWKIPMHEIPDPLNLFQQTDIDIKSYRMIQPFACGEADDFVDLKAEMNCVVAVSACASEPSNAGKCKPIKVFLYQV